MIQKKLQVTNQLGIHARAAARLVQTALKFESNVEINHQGQQANGKSIMAVMMLAASQHVWVDLTVEGPDEEAALYAMSLLFENRFGEER